MASTSNGTGGGVAPRPGVNKVAPRPGPEKENRDPNNLNSHIVVDYYSVMGEPTPSPRSFDCTWEFSELCYDLCYGCLYNICATLFGCWIAMFWGCQLVPHVFAHVWFLTPINNIVKLCCGFYCKSFWFMMARCCVAPYTKACAPLFRYCGDGTYRSPPPTPPLFPVVKRKPKPAPQPVVEERLDNEPIVVAVVPEKKQFDDYDKEKIARSVKRQMMLF